MAALPLPRRCGFLSVRAVCQALVGLAGRCTVLRRLIIVMSLG